MENSNATHILKYLSVGNLSMKFMNRTKIKGSLIATGEYEMHHSSINRTTHLHAI